MTLFKINEKNVQVLDDVVLDNMIRLAKKYSTAPFWRRSLTILQQEKERRKNARA